MTYSQKLFIAVTAFITGVLPAHADTRQDIVRAADEVAVEAQYSRVSEQELRIALRELQAVTDRLRGRANTQPSDLECISRDNDGMAPYIAAIRNRDLTYTRYNNLVFQTIATCRAQLTSAYGLRGGTYLMCSSRDSDGMAPWAIYMLRGTSATSTGETFNTVDACNNAMVRGRKDRTSLLTCVARDRDGMAPWIQIRFNSDGTINRGQAVYNTNDACMAAL